MSAEAGKSEMVKRAAVCRFLEKDLGEVDRMIAEDDLPVVRYPGGSKPSIRIFLPAFHQWSLGYQRGSNEAMADYEVFKRAFLAAQPEPRKKGKRPAPAVVTSAE